MTENPVQPQIVIATITYGACDGDARNGGEGAPTAFHHASASGLA